MKQLKLALLCLVILTAAIAASTLTTFAQSTNWTDDKDKQPELVKKNPNPDRPNFQPPRYQLHKGQFGFAKIKPWNDVIIETAWISPTGEKIGLAIAGSAKEGDGGLYYIALQTDHFLMAVGRTIRPLEYFKSNHYNVVNKLTNMNDAYLIMSDGVTFTATEQTSQADKLIKGCTKFFYDPRLIPFMINGLQPQDFVPDLSFFDGLDSVYDFPKESHWPPEAPKKQDPRILTVPKPTLRTIIPPRTRDSTT